MPQRGSEYSERMVGRVGVGKERRLQKEVGKELRACVKQ